MGAVRANSLIFPRTTSMPRSSEAFSSMKFSRHASPYISFAKARADVVLPVPAGPANIRWGRLPERTYEESLSTISFWPTMSDSLRGRYFSVQISCMISSHIKDVTKLKGYLGTIGRIPEHLIPRPA